MSQQVKHALSLSVVLAMSMWLAGCGAGSPESTIENFKQNLEFTVGGAPVAIPLEKMDIFLTDTDEYPEIFEIHGKGVILVGSFPLDVRVGYGEDWQKLVGKTIEIVARGGDPRGEKDSVVSLPNQKDAAVIKGTFTLESFSEGFDAKTPLKGKIELEVSTPSGPQTFKGTFSVLGTTWG